MDLDLGNLERAVQEIDALEAIYGCEEGCFVIQTGAELTEARSAVESAAHVDAGWNPPQLAVQLKLHLMDVDAAAAEAGTVGAETVAAADDAERGVPAWLRCRLPPGYPAVPAVVAASVSGLHKDSAAQQSLSVLLAEKAAALAGSGAEAIMELAQALEAHGAKALRQARGAGAAAAPAPPALPVPPAPPSGLGRRWIWAHHIVDAGRRKSIVAEARERGLGGYLKSGYPGIVVVEGRAAACDEFVQWLKGSKSRPGGFGRNWGHHVRGESNVPCGGGGGAVDALRRLPAAFADVQEMSALARSGAQVLLLDLGARLGGMVSGGLGRTDGQPSGGIAAEFFARAGGFTFAPSTAAAAFEDMLAAEATHLRVARRCGVSAVTMNGTRIQSLVLDGGARVSAAAYVDASYEGDVMALARVRFAVGREARSKYNESLAGVLPAPPLWHCECNWNLGSVSGVVGGAAANASALLPLVQARWRDAGTVGGADGRVQAYGFRLCLTRDTGNWRPVPRPSDYDPAQWELLRRVFVAHARATGSGSESGEPLTLADFFSIATVAPNKTDVNNGGGLATDFVGASWRWPQADRAQRARLFAAHVSYTQGLFHFLKSDAAVPATLRAEAATWGLARDEFPETDGWPHQLYVREARRMVGSWVFTQAERTVPARQAHADSVAVGGYNMDAHMAQRVLLPDGTVTNEGCLSGGARYYGLDLGAFELPFRLMLPPRRQATNLLVSAAVSASHVGSASLRLEPQYMNLGEAAG
eukprot:g6696.t1